VGAGQGTMVIIGGAEDKEGECRILRKFVQLSGGAQATVVVMTVATEKPAEVGGQYRRLFERLGVSRVRVLHLHSREEADSAEQAQMLGEAGGIFFTGGDQLRITSLLGGTRLDMALRQAYAAGAVVAGTSAGASAMSGTMIVEGDGDAAPSLNTLKMAPGMGLLPEVVVDQHFAQRGRLGRLLTAIAQNPHILGLGIDEDTAVVVTPDYRVEVYGSRTVTVVDGRSITHTNASETSPSEPLALFAVCLHVLPGGYRYDLLTRQPLPPG